MNKRSTGSKLASAASTLIVIAFFMPWIRGCSGEPLSGYQLASNVGGEDPLAWMYWMTPIAAAFVIGLFLYNRDPSERQMRRSAWARLVVGFFGFVPILGKLINSFDNEAAELLYGGWLTVVGFAGVFASVVVDLVRGRRGN